MKSYRHTWEEIISDKNIVEAIKEAARNPSGKKSKKKRKALDKLKTNPDRTDIVKKWIVEYYPIKRMPKEIYDGIARKKRLIYVPSVRETVVQHAVVQVLNKHLMKGVYEHTYAAIKGRGQHKAKSYIERYIQKHPGDVKYYLKMDIRQYFPSVPQDKVIAMLAKQIKDTRTIELVRMILQASDHGIPLGYYISQWLANFYLRDFDHRIKAEVRRSLYIRWMDDMVIFGSSKRKLRRYKEYIENELKSLGLELKGNWKIVRFDYAGGGCFLDFMGFRFYRSKTTLRRSIYMKMCRKALRISKKEKPSVYEIRQFMSYLGWMKHSDTYDAYKQYIKPIISIQQMKRRISRYDKNRANATGDHPAALQAAG